MKRKHHQLRASLRRLAPIVFRARLEALVQKARPRPDDAGKLEAWQTLFQENGAELVVGGAHG